MRKQLLYFLALILAFFACEEDNYYPPGLYGYQVERLLTGGDTAIWKIQSLSIDGVQQDLADCTDSIQFHFLQTSDTLIAYQITSCYPPDTLYLGNMEASASTNSETNEYVFTDSLNFEGGAWDYLIVKHITSTSFRCLRVVSAEDWLYNFEKSGE